MRNKRKVVINLIESGNVHNQRLAEYFARKISERGLNREY